jgi:hypothetical protein
MIRYALDNLGWFEFEGLCQTLLKVKLGLAVEAWGRSGDWGRDAFYNGTLKYPTNEPQTGPFVFQAKFVEAANAAGAHPEEAIVRAVAAECRRLSSRMSPSRRRSHGPITPPNVYVLLTNAPLAASLRDDLIRRLNAVLPSASVALHDGQDLCAWLDTSPETRKAFPQLWGLRDIDNMLREIVAADILNRSRVALEEARLVAPVFIPTVAYRNAMATVEKHHFVVLEGPPEMGKTTIGRMISLAAVSRGWEAVECRDANDVLRAYRDDAPQVFVADDFFGRTEYDARRVTEWQHDLPSVIGLLDDRHWLVLTTRAHLLNLAKLTAMEFSGRAACFPASGEVVVDAGALDKAEKDRIVYRHLKNAGFSEEVRRELRKLAADLAKNPHFTPERIRRLAIDGIPALLGTLTSSSDLGPRLRTLFVASLRDPSEAMEKSFRNLREAEKWLLFAIVEQESSRSLNLGRTKGDSELRQSYERLCPLSSREPYEDVLSALSAGFIREASNGNITWVHPSCRDLAISELARNPRLRVNFLNACNLDGLALALSCAGGPRGDLHLPLLVSDDDWSALKERVVQAESDSVRLLETICRAHAAACLVDGTKIGKKLGKLKELLYQVAWRRVAQILDSNGWSVALVDLFVSTGAHRELSPYRPRLQSLWDGTREDALADAADETRVIWERGFSSFARLAELLEKAGVEDTVDAFQTTVLEVASAWLGAYARERGGTSDDLHDSSVAKREEIEGAYRGLADDFGILANLQAAEAHRQEILDARAEFLCNADEAAPNPESAAPELGSQDEDWDDQQHSGSLDDLFERNPFSDL